MKPFARFSLLLAAFWIAGVILAACAQAPAATLPEGVAHASPTATFPTPTALASCMPCATSTPFPSPLSPASPLPSPSLTITPCPLSSPAPLSATPFPATPIPSASPISPAASPLPLASPACLLQPGRIESTHLTLDDLPGGLSCRIYLPPCYAEQPERSYPVLYLLHGLGSTEDQWVRLGIATAADMLIASGEINPFLIVLPLDTSRLRPSKDPFGLALVDDLIPWVDGQYRTLPGREYRAIGGISRGAAWAVHLGVSQWQLFGAIGAHSLPVFLEDEKVIESWIAQVPLEFFPRVYLDIGDRDRQDVMESATWFEGLLTRHGVSHEWHLFSGDHEDVYWQAHVVQYLRWYAALW